MQTQPPEESGSREDTLVQLYWAIFETWSAQVDSYWTRTNYFGAFEAAAIAATWIVLSDKKTIKGHLYLLFAAAVLVALVLTVAWIFSNVKSYDYHIYWWDVLEEIETRGGWRSRPDYVSAHEARRKKSPILKKFPFNKFPSYHSFTNWVVPIAFFLVWIGLIAGLVVHRWTDSGAWTF